MLRAAALGDPSAHDELWNTFYPKLKAAVRRKVESMPRLANDASDLTSEALQSFFRRAFVDQEFDLNCPNSVWRLLKLMAARHVNDVYKGLLASKRGGGLAHVSLNDSNSGDENDSDWHSELAAKVPDTKQLAPEEEMEWSDLLDRLLGLIKDETARQILLLRLEHHSNSEIADMLQISIRTVQRQLKGIAGIWQQEIGDNQ
jgi:RNA polymerase sigma factor (sigma-70 family)